SEVALRALGPLTLTGLRFAIAALVLSPVAVPAIRRLERRQLAHVAVVAAAGLWGQMVLIYIGINHTNGAIAAIIVRLEPVLIAGWAALLLHERFTSRTATGLAIGLTGSLLVAGVGTAGGASLFGLLCLLGTGVAFSWFTVSSKAFLSWCSPIELTALIATAGALWGFLPMLAELAIGGGVDGATPRTWLMVLYLGVCNS